jgi:hypothetical protein
MNILFNDILQNSDAPKQLVSSSLADYYTNSSELEIILHEPGIIGCVGIGYMNSNSIDIELTNTSDESFQETVNFDKNGLYLLSKEYKNIKEIDVYFTCSRIGRLAFGKAINLKTSIPKEPAFVSTNKPRVTLSGQVIDGLGGYNYRRVSLDTRYKIDNDKLNEIIKGFPSLSRGLPLFISFEEEKQRIPFERLYANDKNQQALSFESSINKMLFSRRWNFEERF